MRNKDLLYKIEFKESVEQSFVKVEKSTLITILNCADQKNGASFLRCHFLPEELTGQHQFFNLNCNFFFNHLSATVISAFRTNMMIFYGCTTVGTTSQGRRYRFIMRTSFIPSRFRYFTLWMCHFYLFLVVIFPFFQRFPPRVNFVLVAFIFGMHVIFYFGQHFRVASALAVFIIRMNPFQRNGQCNIFIN